MGESDIVRFLDTLLGAAAILGLIDVRRTLGRLEKRDNRLERRVKALEELHPAGDHHV